MPDKKYKLTWAERNALLRDLRRIYKGGNELELMQILRRHGVKDQNPVFGQTVRLFRDLRSGKNERPIRESPPTHSEPEQKEESQDDDQ